MFNRLLEYSSQKEKLDLVKRGKLSLIANVNFFLDRIREKNDLNAFNFIFAEEIKQQSKIIEQKILEGTPGRLAGMVIAVKDILSIKNKPLTCSSKVLKSFTSVYSATAIQKLIDADALIIGKTNCDEFAMGSSNENSYFGPVLNPYDNSRVPGGSSGGSAAAVAAELCDASIGTDTGGSIRQPAAFCGVYGIKPTYGRISRNGLTAFASSFDTIGPFANNLEDIAEIMSVISGKDPLDSTSVDLPIPNYSIYKSNIKKIKIGIPSEYFGKGIAADIRNKIYNIINILRENLFDIIDINLPHTEFTLAAYYILTTAEASSNLARYDGAKYGYRPDFSNSINRMYKNSRSEGFGNEVKRRIMLGTYVLSSGYYDAYYLKAQKVRRLIKQDFDNAFKEVDIILSPTTPTTAFKLGEKTSDPLEMYLSDVFTTSANLAGIPAINIPAGKDPENLPLGIQLMADRFEEENLLQAGYLLDNLIKTI